MLASSFQPERRSCFSTPDLIRLVSWPLSERITMTASRWSIHKPANVFIIFSFVVEPELVKTKAALGGFLTVVRDMATAFLRFRSTFHKPHGAEQGADRP